eukprot:755860-Hanusia_phi.AAC.1
MADCTVAIGRPPILNDSRQIRGTAKPTGPGEPTEPGLGPASLKMCDDTTGGGFYIQQRGGCNSMYGYFVLDVRG